MFQPEMPFPWLSSKHPTSCAKSLESAIQLEPFRENPSRNEALQDDKA